MNLVVAGDSWAEGVRVGGQVRHSGIGSFFKTEGFRPINIGKGGFSNPRILDSIDQYLTCSGVDIDLLIVFLTCPLRDWDYHDNLEESYQPDQTPIDNIDQWLHDYWSDVFCKIKGFKSATDAKIVIIGGVTDIPYQCPEWLDLLIPSAATVISEEHFVYPFTDFRFIDRAFDNIQIKNIVLENIEKKLDIWQTLKKRKLFYDPTHPNVTGYKRIFEHIQCTLIKNTTMPV